MEKFHNISNVFKIFAVSVFFSVFALAGSALAQDCPIPSRTVDVGGVAVGADDFEAVKAGLGGGGQSEGRTQARAEPVVEVGLAQVDQADVREVRDLVAGNAEFSAFGGSRANDGTVSIGLAEVSQDEFSGIRDGLGKVAPASKPSGCA